VGVGVPNISVVPAQLNFSPVCVGESATRGLTVHNTGSTAALSVTSIFSTNPRFSVVSPAVPFTVAPNGQRPVTVRFSTTTATPHNGELSIASNGPDAATVAIQLSGSGKPTGRPCPAGLPICCEEGECGGCRRCIRPQQECP